MTNKEKFQRDLEKIFKHLFAYDSGYRSMSKHFTPAEAAASLVEKLATGTAAQLGHAVIYACDSLGIPADAAEIKRFLAGEWPVRPDRVELPLALFAEIVQSLTDANALLEDVPAQHDALFEHRAALIKEVRTKYFNNSPFPVA
jgi:hypothetical protein